MVGSDRQDRDVSARHEGCDPWNRGLPTRCRRRSRRAATIMGTCSARAHRDWHGGRGVADPGKAESRVIENAGVRVDSSWSVRRRRNGVPPRRSTWCRRVRRWADLKIAAQLACRMGRHTLVGDRAAGSRQQKLGVKIDAHCRSGHATRTGAIDDGVGKNMLVMKIKAGDTLT